MPITADTAHALCDITSAFYRAHAASFSSTRQAPWAGWARVLECALPDGGARPRTLRVFDLACGNLRFGRFAAERFPEAAVDLFAVDNCDELACGEGAARLDPQRADARLRPSDAEAARARGGSLRVSYQSLDVAAALFEEGRLSRMLDAPACDLCVSFGFMHHLPLPAQRAEALSALVDRARPGGTVAVSFWRFLSDPGLVAKARESTARACAELGLPKLDAGDCVLGWQGEPGAWRYCHSFSEEEVEALAAGVAQRAEAVARFSADGRNGALNEYLVLRAR